MIDYNIEVWPPSSPYQFHKGGPAGGKLQSRKRDHVCINFFNVKYNKVSQFGAVVFGSKKQIAKFKSRIESLGRAQRELFDLRY